MLKNAPVVILDEATAYIDPENEAVIQQAVARLVEGKTVIVIAHRLSTITDANQNFSKVARLVDENGSVIILKNNVPRYLVMEFSAAEQEQLAVDEDVMAISKRLIEKNRQAYEVLAK